LAESFNHGVPEHDPKEAKQLTDNKQKFEKRPPPDPFQSYLLLLALSVHSIFEGIAIGVQRSTSSAVKLMIAVIVHKQVASLALGISFGKAQTEMW
jgi:zinc transporter ZupT